LSTYDIPCPMCGVKLKIEKGHVVCRNKECVKYGK